MTKVRGFEKVSFKQWDTDNNVVPESRKCWDEIQLPQRATSGSAGYDIYSTIDFILKPTESIIMPLGFKVYMQDDEDFTIIPRSGMGFKYYIRLANTTGLIDSDFYNNAKTEGHCWIKLRNEGDRTIIVKTGDAIAQGIFRKNLRADNDQPKSTERVGGLGSTG